MDNVVHETVDYGLERVKPGRSWCHLATWGLLAWEVPR